MTQNLISLFENTVQKNPHAPCFTFSAKNQWHTLTWGAVRTNVIKIAGGLKALGVQKGDRVAILSKTRYEWTLADLGILAAGAITVPIYESNTTKQAQYILEDSEAKIVFAENHIQHNKIAHLKQELPALSHIVYFDSKKLSSSSDSLYSLDELMTIGSQQGPDVYAQSCSSLTLNDDASFVYTSGTTGNPKGAILTHENFIAEVEDALEICPIEKDYVALQFLPQAHILGRVAQFFHIYVGCTQAFAESIDKLVDNIGQIKPHYMVSVPRIFEKIHARTLQNIEAASTIKKKIFYWALRTGQKYSHKMRHHEKIGPRLSLKHKIASKLVFSKLHKKMGGRVQFFISGGAPLSADIALFFHAFGFTILEGYGLTETTAGISFNRNQAIKFGTVGQPIPSVEMKLAKDGEILVKGRVVFKGYFKNEKATQEAIDQDGWFHTGDIGTFDSERFLTITDRKKDIIVTAGGKNIAPQNIENFMKEDPYISHFVVHGDKRKFLSALVTLDQPEIERLAKERQITYNNYEELVKNTTVFTFIKERIESKNKTLPSYETIKRFAILPTDFSIETGELTPTLKVKRKVITERYGNMLDAFYSD
ncbi:long-chain fatty acid--CoA ligase [bacterium]|nr:long-chain fatty acid--CoA ligase [bacterium]